MSERVLETPDPTYPPEVPADVAAECRAAWMEGRPWTRLRVLRDGAEALPGGACEGSSGKFLGCPKRPEAVQYASSCGAQQLFCEEHALEQVEWDRILYDSQPAERPDPGPEWHAEVEQVMKRLYRKKREERDDEEDPE